jgi:hypothetical protein
MNRKNVEKALFPSFEEGAAAPIKQMYRYLIDSALPGRSNATLRQDSDLPRCALFKVA